MIPEDAWEQFLGSGEAYGFLPRRRNSLEFARRSRVMLFSHHTGIEVDISLGGIIFEKEMIERAVPFPLPNGQIPLATPEDLIVMKSLAMRPNDITDIIGLLDANKSVDVDRVRYWVHAFAEELDTPEIAQEIDSLLHRHGRKKIRPERKPRNRRKKQ